jgi:hypothetical protein
VGVFPAGHADLGRADEPSWHYTFAGETRRGFCPVCGTQLCALDDGGDSIAFTLSALDDATGLDPMNQSFRGDAVAWLPRFPIGAAGHADRGQLPSGKGTAH